MDLVELANIMRAIGCPEGKADEMAAQMNKRARQLAVQKGCSYEESLTHLLKLMKQGWAAQRKGMGPQR